MRTSCTAAKFYPFYCKILQVNKRAGVFVIGKCRIVGKSLEPINKTQTHKLGILWTLYKINVKFHNKPQVYVRFGTIIPV